MLAILHYILMVEVEYSVPDVCRVHSCVAAPLGGWLCSVRLLTKHVTEMPRMFNLVRFVCRIMPLFVLLPPAAVLGK